MIRTAALAVLLSTAAVLTTAQPSAPLGHLVLIGGGARPSYVMDRIAELAGGRSARVLVVPVASSRPDEAAEALVAELERAGVGQVEVLSYDAQSTDSWETLERVNQASGIMFAGGDQAELAASLRGTRLLDNIRELYDRGGVIAGTSAGATALGSLMILGGATPDADPDRAIRVIRAGAVATAPGLDLLPGSIVDQHFIQRRRHNRLLTAVLENPGLLAIGIDEETAIIVGPPSRLEVLGENLVAIYDLSWGSPVDTDRAGNLAADGISMHLLRSGQVFDLEGRGVAP